MALETKLVQKLSQTLLMTPQLRQAIELLQLGRLEYIQAVEKELLENPILEELRETEAGNEAAQRNEAPAAMSDSAGDGSGGEASGESEAAAPAGDGETPAARTDIDWEGYLDSFSDWRGSASPRGMVDFDERPSLEATLTRSESLSDHLFSQLRMLELSERELSIATQVIGNLDRDGYLCISHDEIVANCGCTPDEVADVIELVQSLDPVGIGARNLQECLIVQLGQMGLSDGLEARILRDHLDKLEKRKFELIAKAEGATVDQVYKAILTIRRLEPRPGRQFAEDPARYIVPDIYVQKVGSEFVITMNDDGMPRLRVSPYYLQLLKSGESENVPNKSYLNERLKAATWLIKSIHQRQNTIYRVTESIVKFQREFLEQGIHKLRPLVLKDVADDIGMHESTVSRVTTNKYVHTPQGVFELKYFFTSGVKSESGDVSSSAIKEKIKNLIAREDPEKPISDQEIVELLRKEEIVIARRTVAKYRESLGIESSSRRKKPF